jgi:Cu/Ag efflux pump CusA
VIKRMVDTSLRFPVLIGGLVVGLVAAAFTQLQDMPVDALPDFAPVSVEVQTESLGLSAVEVEQLMTAPMEQLLLNGVPWLQEMSSESIPGLSSISLVFEPGTDPLEARQVVAERLSQGRDLPKVAKAPVMLQPRSSTSRVMMIRLDSTNLTPIEQSVLARWTIKPALMGVPGVANVAIWGQREQQMQVQVDPVKLGEHGVSLSQVVTTSANSLWVSPLSYVKASTPGTGGFIDTPNQRLGLQHILPITEPADLGKVTLEKASGDPLISNGKPVLLGDVVSVVQDHQPLIGDAVAGRSQGLMLVVEKFPEANVTEVTRDIEASLAELSPGLSGVEFDTTVFRPASYIDLAQRNLALALGLGLLLVVGTLGLLHSWRLAVVGAIALPLSVLSAALVLHLLGAGMNLMVIAGLVTAAAAVIGDAVVDFDNATRRARAAGSSSRSVLVEATYEMRRAMLFAGLIMVAAAVPVFYLGLQHGLDAAFFKPIALAYVLALLVSMIVALTVVPVLSLLLLRGDFIRKGESARSGRMTATYSSLFSRMLGKPGRALAAFGVVAALGLVLAPLLDLNPGTALKERTLLVHWQTAPGTSHAEMTRITDRVATELRDVPGIDHVGGHIGRALTSDEISSVDSGELWLSLSADADHDETMSAVGDIVAGYPGIKQQVLSYSTERQQAHGIGATSPDQVVVRVYGQQTDVLAAKAAEVQNVISGISGVENVTVGSQPQQAQIEVQVDLTAAQRYGLTPGEVRRSAAILVAGIEVGSLFQEQKVFEVMVVGAPAARHNLSIVNDLLIDTPDGKQVRLGDVATVRVTPVPTVVRHNRVSRYLDVTAAVKGESVGDVADDVEDRIGELTFPLEYHTEILGDYEDENSAELRVLGFASAALVAMLLLFQAYLRSWKLAITAMVGLPLALSGGVLLAGLTGGLTLGSLLGALVLIGVYTRSLLGLFALYRRTGGQRGELPDSGAVAQGVRERFLPTLVLTVALAALSVPLIIFARRPGLEVLGDIGVFVVGGLLTTTALTLFFLPLAYAHLKSDEDTPAFDGPQSNTSDSGGVSGSSTASAVMER